MNTLFQNICAAYPAWQPSRLLEEHHQTLSSQVVWTRIRGVLENALRETAGICVNMLQFSPRALQPFAIQFHADGVRRLQQDASLQRAIANAYWQTVWAEGAIRTARGTTVPVAFVALERQLATRFSREENLVTKTIAPGHYFVGQEEILLQEARESCLVGRLRWRDGRFDGVSAAVSQWLNERAFIDQFIGDNQSASSVVTPTRLVPVVGSHRIAQFIGHEQTFFAPPAAPAPESTLAASNSGFFLNFPEEYRNRWCAMNDPVGLLIQGGHLHQLPLTRRGALLVDHDGKTIITRVGMADMRFRLPWAQEWYDAQTSHAFLVDDAAGSGRQPVVYTPAYLAEGSPEGQRTPAGEVVDYVIVFGKIFESKIGGEVEIPGSGIVLSLPVSAYPNEVEQPLALLQKYGRFVRFELDGTRFGLAPITTALGAGPILVDDDRIISDQDFSPNSRREEFKALQMENGDVKHIGIAPTRFPHDAETTRAPRTVIGTTATGEIVLLVIDGRLREHSLGATLQEAARIAVACGCTQALNLDGGGSSVLFLRTADGPGQSPLLPHIKPGIVSMPSDTGNSDRLLPVPLLVAG